MAEFGGERLNESNFDSIVDRVRLEVRLQIFSNEKIWVKICLKIRIWAKVILIGRIEQKLVLIGRIWWKICLVEINQNYYLLSLNKIYFQRENSTISYEKNQINLCLFVIGWVNSLNKNYFEPEIILIDSNWANKTVLRGKNWVNI